MSRKLALSLLLLMLGLASWDVLESKDPSDRQVTTFDGLGYPK